MATTSCFWKCSKNTRNTEVFLQDRVNLHGISGLRALSWRRIFREKQGTERENSLQSNYVHG